VKLCRSLYFLPFSSTWVFFSKYFFGGRLDRCLKFLLSRDKWTGSQEEESVTEKYRKKLCVGGNCRTPRFRLGLKLSGGGGGRPLLH
jgi:hypothetical protein